VALAVGAVGVVDVAGAALGPEVLRVVFASAAVVAGARSLFAGCCSCPAEHVVMGVAWGADSVGET
jgi:hypothetical protein